MNTTAGFTELMRPWKLFSLTVGIAILIGGAHYTNAPDWDITFSIILAIETYLTAAWSMWILVVDPIFHRGRQWRWIPVALFLAWFTVDGSYCLYWSIVNPEGLDAMRDANFYCSMPLYGIMGLVWMWGGSLRELWNEIKACNSPQSPSVSPVSQPAHTLRTRIPSV